MNKNIEKVVLYAFVATGVLFSVIVRVGMSGLAAFIDFPSLFWIIMGILFTGLNFQLKDVFTVLLYLLNRKTVAKRPQYYQTVLREVNKNIFRFALLGFVIGVFLCFTRIESAWGLTAGIMVGAIPLFYALVLMIFVIKPIETVISQIDEEKVKKNLDSEEPSPFIGNDVKKMLFVLWNILAVCGLGFMITIIAIEFSGGGKEREYKVAGKVKEMYSASWNWCGQRYALVETDDGKGDAIVEIFQYDNEIKEGTEVPLIIIAHSASPGFKRMYARIDREETHRLKDLRRKMNNGKNDF